MQRLGILAADSYLRDRALWAALADHYEWCDLGDWRQWDEAQLLEKLRSVDVVVTGRSSPTLPLALAKDFGRLRLLCHCHGTVRHLADKRLIKAGLRVTNWGDAVAGVAEGAMAMLLCMLKQLVTLNAFAKGQPDQRIHQAYPCTLEGRDVGLYGFGPIGRHMARMLEGFRPRIAIYDPFARDVPAHIRVCSTLKELFSTCQIISIHCGLNDQTRGSVSAEMLALLPQGGIVVNTARGDIVDEAALGREVAAGRLLAALDVIADEKKWDWKGSPVAPYPGSILTLHGIGGGKGYPPGMEPKPQVPAFVIKNLVAFAQRQPLINEVTAEAYDLKT
jgi:phosphoglycerate dehydrogenase-like enzyme